jgi:Amt family ammonium transporter
LSILAFFAVGFGIAFGGLGLIYPQNAGFDGLVWEWSLLSSAWGPQWGMAGLSGWALGGGLATEAVYQLFYAQLPWVATAAMIPLLALRGRTPALSSLLGGLLVGGLLYPLATNWLWGGGWLFHLGTNINLGHGFVDFAGASTVHLLGGAVALAGLLVAVPRLARHQRSENQAIPLPPAHMPLLASVGAILLLIGSSGWAWANPLLSASPLMLQRGAINALLVAAAGALLPLAYTWFVANQPDPVMAARGLAAGAIAGAAVGPFVAPWGAIALGAIVGLLVPMITYLMTEVLRVADDTGILPMHLLGAAAGLVAVGLLADGMAGLGWNQVGTDSFLTVSGQGVTGLMAQSGFRPDWPGQMQAQLIGIAALFLIPFLAGTLMFGFLTVLDRGLHHARTRQPQPAADTPNTDVLPDQRDEQDGVPLTSPGNDRRSGDQASSPALQDPTLTQN